MVIEGLNFAYGSNLIFRNFDFYSDSPVTALSGPSGCGKTTLLKIMSGNLEAQAVRLFIGEGNLLLVIQEDSMLPWLSGYENLKLVFPDPREKFFKHDLYPLVEPYLTKKAFEMSFGQRRLLEVFRAIVAKPTVLMLDEPFNFLDNDYRRMIVRSLLQLSRQSTRIIFSSHYKDDLSDLDARVFYFDGKFPIERLSSKNF